MKLHDLQRRASELASLISTATDAAAHANLRKVETDAGWMYRCGNCLGNLSCAGGDDFWCRTCFPAFGAWSNEHRAIIAEISRKRTRLASVISFRNQRRQAMLEVGRYYSHCFFRTYRAMLPGQADAWDQVSKWAASDRARHAVPFVLLSGKPGLGKSHLAVAAWRKLSRHHDAVFVDESRLCEEWRQSHQAYARKTDYDGPNPDDIIEKLKNATVLIWDDIGKMKSTDAWFAVVFAVLNHRMASGLATLFASNYTPAELGSRLEPSLARRVAGGIVLKLGITVAAA